MKKQIKQSFKQIRISVLKKRAHRLYASYEYECNQMSCGRALAEQVNPRVLRAKFNFNKTIDKLRELDPSVPERAKL